MQTNRQLNYELLLFLKKDINPEKIKDLSLIKSAT